MEKLAQVVVNHRNSSHANGTELIVFSFRFEDRKKKICYSEAIFVSVLVR